MCELTFEGSSLISTSVTADAQVSPQMVSVAFVLFFS